MKNKNSILAVALGALTLAVGCSDLKTNLPSPVAPGVQAHRPEWVDTSSAGFHGKVIQAANGDARQCLTCHGLDYQGGASGISCVKCHQEKGASLHGRGWVDESSSNFHGTFVRSANWDMRSCQSCHGTVYDGGKVGVSCRTCHTGGAGPENCATCHGGTANPAPPRDLNKNTAATFHGVGAHQVHLLGSSVAGMVACGECHIVPGSVYDPGHIDTSPGAELRFGSLASSATNEPWTEDYDPQLPTTIPIPSYNAAAFKCANTYCHGNFKNGNPTVAPTWTDVSGGQSKCGICHGSGSPLHPTLADTLAAYVPKTDAPGQGGTHPNIVNGAAGPIRCSVCHAGVVDDKFRIINAAKHVNGKLNILDEFGVQVERDF